MTDLFIPPERAMQFEITNPEVFAGNPTPLALWVGDEEPRRKYDRACSCPTVRPVYRDSVNGPVLNAGRPVVCACLGRIIE